jgi:hypothetical protein
VDSEPERSLGDAPFAQLELRKMWTYTDGVREVKAYRTAAEAAGCWAIVDERTGRVEGTLPAGEFSRRFRPVDVFADVTGFPTYLGTMTAADGTALVDLILDRDPFMLANGPRRAARPHVLMVPRRHRDGWSSATAAELAARDAAMTLVAAWYRTLDGGHAVFCANDSPPNDGTTSKNPRQEVQHAHLHAFYAEDAETDNHESAAATGHRVAAAGYRAFADDLGGDAVRVEADVARLAAGVRAAAQPWGGSYCSYQRGVAGPFWVMPAIGSAQDEFNRCLARADGLRAAPDPRLGGAVNLVRPSLADPTRLQAAQRAIAEQRTAFRAFAARAFAARGDHPAFWVSG